MMQLFFCKCSKGEALEVMNVLQIHADASGQVINMEKSSHFFSAHCVKKQREKIIGCTHIKGRDNFVIT